ncbi:heterokaryon incompatibility protein-domain-containing protein [Dendryphion nanum]|uniref:Heterokaryon incompatibility protein-domain-containing protein n=1 Tax=Dendryphion nanum TaxID=256645 RepID=A0A9P9IMB5_9PLEO|nr:heterokaryon incompatibility protein-domain-containing protein [Dendryphion nanum]
MPLPKSLRTAKRTAGGSSAQSQRTKCPRCHNLDPRGHRNSTYQAESAKESLASLSLVIDALSLSRNQVSSSSKPDCRFCMVLVQALDAFFQGWRTFRGRVLLDIQEKSRIRVGIDTERWKNEQIEIFTGSAPQSALPSLGSVLRIRGNAGSDDTFDFARNCIKDCLTNPIHTACRETARGPVIIPKRLIDVGRSSTPIHLVDTQGRRAVQYAALSHCWGKSLVLTVTKANWQTFASHIPFESLPPLFQDAVIITRQLGLCYLWIDSLCIIQDSKRDWETESAKMGGIYEGSYVTICATNSRESNERCLVDREKPVKIAFQKTNGKECILGARRILEHHPITNEQQPARLVGPLTSRAWTLQEHVLSTRVLHYTATELLFECKTSYRCECFAPKKIYPTTPALIPKAIAKKQSNHRAIWDAWQNIVTEYSKRNLTVAADRLPAISGIANKIALATGSSYIAGIWKKNLVSDLVWSSSSGHAPGYALDAYRAPTFSWASLDVPVTYYDTDDEERASLKSSIVLLSSSISPTGLNPLGTVADASIKVRGPCLSATLSSIKKEDIWEYTLLLKGTSAIRISHDCLLTEADHTSDPNSSEKTVRRASPESTLAEFKAPVLCLTVARYDSWISGLVLGSSDRTRGAWERLGTFSAGSEGFVRASEKEILVV